MRRVDHYKSLIRTYALPLYYKYIPPTFSLSFVKYFWNKQRTMVTKYSLSGLFVILILVHCITDEVNGVSPVPGKKVTTAFGVKGSMWALGYHTGADYACPIGTKVVATKDGVVKNLNWGAGLGTHVIIESKESSGKVIQHVYAHLSKKTVKAGDKVKAGQEIAKSGNTGQSTGPHVHYAERVSPFAYANHRKPQFS
jgi:murein DD-endopeptidase MepM/ murein hydrolase activator NlpD